MMKLLNASLLSAACVAFLICQPSSARERASASVQLKASLSLHQPAPVDASIMPSSLSAVPPGSVNERHFVLSLARLTGQSQPVMLRGVTNSFTLSLPVPALWKPMQVSFELAGIASRALIDTSQIAISVNGRVIKQLPLGNSEERFLRRMSIPTSALHAGFNDVRIEVAQHYTNICEYPLAPQLWTELDLANSRFLISATRAPITPQLSSLNELFDKASWEDRPVVELMTAAAPSPAELSALALITQGVAQRFDYLPVQIVQRQAPARLDDLAAQLRPGTQGAVLVGTFGKTRSFLQGMNVPETDGPVVALRALPDHPEKFLLIVAAATHEELNRAANTLALRNMPWPGNAWIAIQRLQLPENAKLEGRFGSPLAPSSAFPLRALGFRSTTYSGTETAGSSLRLWNSSWQGRAQIRLHLAYAAGMSSQSAFNIVANKVLQGSIPLNSPVGGAFDDYAVSIPAGALKPGWNTIELQPVLIPVSNGGECKPFFNGNLAITIYEDSTIQKFGGSSLKQPDLALLSGEGGFDLHGQGRTVTAIRLTDISEATVGAGLTLLAKLIQVHHGPFTDPGFGIGDAGGANNQFWVGTQARLPNEVKAAFFSALPKTLSLQVPFSESSTVSVLEGGEWFSTLLDRLGFRRGEPKFSQADLDMSGGLGSYVFARTSQTGEKTVTVFTAENDVLLEKGINRIIGFGPWSELRGPLAFWEVSEQPVRTVSPLDVQFSTYGLRGGLGLVVSQYPWTALFVVLLCIAFLALLTIRILRGSRNKQSS